MEEKDYTPYCPVCESCGEDGCCSALNCEQKPDGKYCETYLELLKNAYRFQSNLFKIVYADELKYKDIILIMEKLWDDE